MTATATPSAALGTAPSHPGRSPIRVLMLTHRLPYPPDRGDRIRSYHLLKYLSEKFDVAVACVSDEPVWLQHHQLLRTMATRVTLQPISNSWSALRGGAALLTGGAITPAWHYRVGLSEAILQWHEQKPFDVVLTFCTGMIGYARTLIADGIKHNRPVKHILDLVDVDSMKWDSYARAAMPPLSWVYKAEGRRLRAIEAGRRDSFDAVTVVSDAEAAAYRSVCGDHPGLTVVRNGVALDYFIPQPDPDNHTMVFVGVLSYRPNAEGITWFAKKVMPLLRQRVPDAHLLIVGRHPTPAVQVLTQIPGVEVVGSVPDVRTYIRESSLAIAPLLIARGVQNKVLEAMSCQRTVVCSPGAAQGVDAEPGKHFLVADNPGEWATTIQKAFNDHDARRAMAAVAHRHVTGTYSWPAAIAPMVDLIHKVAGGLKDEG